MANKQNLVRLTLKEIFSVLLIYKGKKKKKIPNLEKEFFHSAALVRTAIKNMLAWWVVNPIVEVLLI